MIIQNKGQNQTWPREGTDGARCYSSSRENRKPSGQHRPKLNSVAGFRTKKETSQKKGNKCLKRLPHEVVSRAGTKSLLFQVSGASEAP